MKTVILVDAHGMSQGTAELREAHTGEGMLHKAFSVYVFRGSGRELLMQQRSGGKMLWPGFWANTCCSHPRHGEDINKAAQRRLQEELGFTCALRECGSYVYRAEDPDRGVEHEHVTIFIGELTEDAVPKANPEEIAQWKWIPIEELKRSINEKPDLYAPWFPLGLRKVLSHP